MARKSKIPGGPTTAPKPPSSGRRLGGQELPDNVQDRPEQNAGYDEAVRGERGTPIEPRDDAEVIDVEPGARDADLRIESDEDQ